MPKLASIPFAIQLGSDGVPQNSAESLTNMFSEITVTGSRANIIRRQRAGLRAIYAQTGEKRCIERNNSIHYAIIGNTFYSFNGVTLTSRGTLGTSTGRCTMIFNDNDEVMISDGALLYWWNGVTLALVTNTSAFIPGNLSYLNGYGIVNSVGTDQFFITGANDFSTIDPLDFATAESNPDALQTTFTDHNEIWLVGTQTIEIWQDTGGSDFPFQAITTAKIERGSPAPYSVAADDNTVIMLCDDLIVYRFEGYRPSRISTHAVEYLIRNCTAMGRAAAYALIYTHQGHKFYTLTIPGELTVQYNFATQRWNQATTYAYSAWNVIGSNGHYADYVLTDAGIASIDPDIYQDEGGVLPRKAVSAPGWADGRKITMPMFYADCEVGRADVSVTPTIDLRVALEGETFGNYRTRSLGNTGQYNRRVTWEGNGQGRKPVFELTASGNFRLTIMGTLLNASVGNN